MEKRIVAQSDLEEFWLVGSEIYRAYKPSMLDIYGLPSAKRWECSYSHWLHFRNVYGWAIDI